MNCCKQHVSRSGCFKIWIEALIALHILLAFLSLAQAIPQESNFQTVYLRDHSDWWSLLNENAQDLGLSPGNQPLDEKHFAVAGILLRKMKFESVEKKLGRGVIVSRGDASTGREQVCYFSESRIGRQYLVLEFGEEVANVYLFLGGNDWTGKNYCAQAKVKLPWKTSSGLLLGMLSRDLETNLGKPEHRSGDRIIYARDFERKATPGEFGRLRSEYPQKVSDALARQMFGTVQETQYLEARFKNSRLVYLALSFSGFSDE